MLFDPGLFNWVSVILNIDPKKFSVTNSSVRVVGEEAELVNIVARKTRQTLAFAIFLTLAPIYSQVSHADTTLTVSVIYSG